MSVATPASLRRGACPGLSVPMPTGDGLLARLMPIGTISLDAMSGLCAAARRHGNGVIEITSRGSIQVRGLSEASAPAFADAVAELGIAAHDGVPVIADPLAGLDPNEVVDATALAAELRARLAIESFVPRLSPKVSVAIDGGGALHLDALAADVRLQAVAAPDGARVRVALGGDAASAVPLRTVALSEAIDTVAALLEKIASHGPSARGHDVAGAGAHASPARIAADPIGVFRMHDGRVAVGIGFPFGHSDFGTLATLVHAARDVDAFGLRTSPGRALLVLGIADDLIAQFVCTARSLGFIVARDDPRRRVVACAGAPVCAAAKIPARALAPQIAASSATLIGAHEVIHVSGCAKGCAHHGPAALTAIGRGGGCELLVGDAPAGSCAVENLPDRLAALAANRSARHG